MCSRLRELVSAVAALVLQHWCCSTALRLATQDNPLQCAALAAADQCNLAGRALQIYSMQSTTYIIRCNRKTGSLRRPMYSCAVGAVG
jgi:hypothetical protein